MTHNVCAILKFINDKPESVYPSFFTEADQACFDETCCTSHQFSEHIAAKHKLLLANCIKKPRLAEHISADTNTVPTALSLIIDLKNKSHAH